MRTNYTHEDLTGLFFNRLTVLRCVGKTPTGRDRWWLCRCICGTEKAVRGNCLKRSTTKSCGCLLREKPSGDKNPAFRHGQVGTRIYRSWHSMIQRCTNPKNPKYPRYGGRGVAVCKRWMTFANFFSDMGACPDGLTIGRMDNDGNYEPKNCRWETDIEQANNRSNNRLTTINGETKTTAQWAKALGISHAALRNRLHKGWSIERAFRP